MARVWGRGRGGADVALAASPGEHLTCPGNQVGAVELDG